MTQHKISIGDRFKVRYHEEIVLKVKVLGDRLAIVEREDDGDEDTRLIADLLNPHFYTRIEPFFEAGKTYTHGDETFTAKHVAHNPETGHPVALGFSRWQYDAGLAAVIRTNFTGYHLVEED